MSLNQSAPDVSTGPRPRALSHCGVCVCVFPGELEHLEGAGGASGSEMCSARLQHTRRLCLGDEHGQEWEDGGQLPG